ncbi:hypothetical protein [Gilvimarinus chinensis]|uniref:hypothetical protein n=1 Tax=Gilvimarinus chinensis TaxID=396005 RepID=UPI00036F280C|nr:hypothetical protein [Gilvimarinus chinensis]
MIEDYNKRTVLLIMRFSNENSSKKHKQEYAPKIQRLIEKLSSGACKMAFASPGGDEFGFFLRTNTPLRVIRAKLYGTAQDADEALLLSGDSLLALEIGSDFDGQGYSAAWTWLQHHHGKD